MTGSQSQLVDTAKRSDAGKPRPNRRTPVMQRILAKAEQGENGCWNFTGYLQPKGYGTIQIGRKNTTAHRAMYEAIYGELPDDLVVDHLCRNRACVNPMHLEPVSIRENNLRSPISKATVNGQKTHCPRGHEYTPENTRLQKSRTGGVKPLRSCKECRREQDRLKSRKRRTT